MLTSQVIVFVSAVTVALVASFLCSIAEAVLLSVGHAQVQAHGRSRAGRILKRFKSQIDVPIAAILVLNTLAHTIGASVAGSSFEEVFPGASVGLFAVVLSIAILVFTEIIPKTLGVSFAARLAAPVAMGVQVLVIVLKPVLILTRALSKLLTRGNTQPVTSIEEIRLLATLGRTEGALGARVAGIIEGAAALRELTAYDVMVPRAGVAFLSGERTWEENLTVIRRSAHSRFPYSPTGDLDKVEGIVLTKELFFQQQEEGKLDFSAALRPLLVVPVSMPLERLLRTFQEERKHMAIAVDEYGGSQGIVTLEDVLEEIVGEIEDESDRFEQNIVRRPDGALVCRGWAETRKVLSCLGEKDEQDEEERQEGQGEEQEEPDSVTVNGLLAELVGRVPKTGDTAEYKGYRFTVLRATARRAERIEVRRLSELDQPAPND